MKRFFPLLLPLIAFAGLSCERHEFEGPDGTKQLHEHGHHGENHGKGHGESPANDKPH